MRADAAYEFQMRGIGYGHPSSATARWKGEMVVGGERLALPVDDPCDRDNVHIQALCDATFTRPDGEVEHGIGILEQMCIGEHPSGLSGIADPA